jgi:hypothetical protein
MFDEYEIPVSTRKARTRSRWERSSLCGGIDWKNQDFDCVHCRGYVSTQYILAGVHNRNHCPYCLWSRHMDWIQAGDRLSACKAGMQPVGLTLKRQAKKYAAVGQGELMLVHQCIDCGQFSINRIAADDDAEGILKIFEASQRLSHEVLGRLNQKGIQILTEGQRQLVTMRLFGQN